MKMESYCLLITFIANIKLNIKKWIDWVELEINAHLNVLDTFCLRESWNENFC